METSSDGAMPTTRTSAARATGATKRPRMANTTQTTFTSRLCLHTRHVSVTEPSKKWNFERGALRDAPRHVLAPDVRRRRAAQKLQRKLDLRPQQLEHPRHSILAAGRQPPEDRTSDEHRARTESQRPQHVRAAPYAAVEVDVDAPADGLRHLRQRVQRAGHAVELAAAVVRHDDSVGPVLAGE